MAGATASFGASGDAQLVMMEEAGCSWCEKWDEEIGAIYEKTSEGQRAPLRRVDVHDPMPKDLSFLRPAYFTPTFILVHGDKEIGRIQGYPGEDFFWPMLAELIDKLPREGAVRAHKAK
ncbi:MAG: transcriptional regulator [Alphaproteobacteria bacterium]|nr:transcriptional regulator [Alphaproteobacteria bacterium]